MIHLKANFSYMLFVAVLVSFLLFFLAFAKLFSQELIFYIGLPFSITIALFSYNYLFDTRDLSFQGAKPSLIKTSIFFLTVASIVAVLYIPSCESSSLDWNSISLLNYLRFLASLMLTTFIPGYFLLKILDRKGSFKSGVVFILSFLLSIFISFTAGYFILFTGNSISLYGTLVMIVVCLVLMFGFLIADRKKGSPSLFTINWAHDSLVVSVVVLIVIASLFIMINNLPLTYGDMWDHLGSALLFTNSFPVHNGLLPSYPYLFAIYQAVTFTISGLPAILTEQLFYLLNFIPVLAFYVMLKDWFKEKNDKKLPEFTIFLSTLLGFGSLYAIYLKITEQLGIVSTRYLLQFTSYKTYDIYLRTGYIPDIVAPIWLIGIPVFLMLLLLIHNNSGIRLRFPIIIMLFITGYLGHEAEMYIFVLIYFIYVIFFAKKGEGLLALSIPFALLISLILNLIVPSRIFIIDSSWFFFLILSIISTIISLTRDYHTFSIQTNKFRLIENSLKIIVLGIKPYLKWILIYFYIISIILWFIVLNDYVASGYFVPFFVFPIRLGILSVFLSISIILFSKNLVQNRSLSFFLILSFFGFAVEQLANHYDIGYPSSRFAMYTFFGACVIGAYFIKATKERFSNSRPKKKYFGLLLILLSFIPGVLGTSLYFISATEYNNHNPLVTNLELTALNYVKNNLNSSQSVVTFSSDSKEKLTNLVGINSLQIINDNLHYFFKHSDPAIPLDIFGNSQVKFLYINKVTDYPYVGYYSPFILSLLKYLPIAYENNDVVIYEVPSITPPSDVSCNLVVYPSQESSYLNFNNGYVSINNSNNFNLVNNITVECWINTKQEKQSQMIISKDDFGDARAQWYLAIDNGRIVWALNINNSFSDIKTSQIIGQGSFYHVVATYENSVGRKIYVNGQLICQDNCTGDLNDDNQKLLIGASQNGTKYPFKGYIYGVKIYNKSLTSGEVQASYDENYDDENGLILDLAADEGSGIVLTDDSSNGNNGLIFGVDWVTEATAMNLQKIDLKEYLLPSILGWDYKILDQSISLPQESINSLIQNSSIAIFLEDPQANYSKIINWVEAGGKIVVFDGELGYFSQLLNISVLTNAVSVNGIVNKLGESLDISEIQIPEILTNNLEMIANFTNIGSAATPLVLAKNFGNGSIYYVRSSCILSAIETLNSSQISILKKIFESICVSFNTSLLSDHAYPDLPDYDCFAGGFNSTGNITIASNYLSMLETSLNNKIELNSDTTHLSLQNVKIESLNLFGASSISLFNTSADFSIATFSSTTIVNTTQQSEICINSPEATRMELIFTNSSGSYEITTYGGNILLVSESISFRINNPEVHISGNAFFVSPYIHSSSYSLIGSTISKLSINGNISFNIIYSESAVAFISSFSYSGYTTTLEKNVEFGLMSQVFVFIFSISNFYIISIIILFASFEKIIRLNVQLRKVESEK